MGDSPAPLQGDPSHGRLFTLPDVKILMSLTASRTWEHASDIWRSLGVIDNAPKDSADAVAQIEELLADASAAGILTFATDEPMFLLRGTDRATVPAVGAYGVASEHVDAGHDHMANVITAASQILTWQRANPDRLRTPPVPIREEQP